MTASDLLLIAECDRHATWIAKKSKQPGGYAEVMHNGGEHLDGLHAQLTTHLEAASKPAPLKVTTVRWVIEKLVDDGADPMGNRVSIALAISYFWLTGLAPEQVLVEQRGTEGLTADEPGDRTIAAVIAAVETPEVTAMDVETIF
jgi:hypothetical protein